MPREVHLVYIDFDSGTVLNGPIYAVEIPEEELEDVLDSDSTARDWCELAGRQLLP